MTTASSALDPQAMARAKAPLAKPEPRQRMWPVLKPRALLAVAALSFATAMIMAPPLHTEHTAKGASE